MRGNTHYASNGYSMIPFIFYNMQYIIIHNLIQKPDHYCLLAEWDGIISEKSYTKISIHNLRAF